MRRRGRAEPLAGVGGEADPAAVGQAAADLGGPAPATLPHGWRGTWTPARARLWLGAAAVAAWLPALGMPLRGWLDFAAFYAAGHFAFGRQLLELGPLVTWQQAHGLPLTPFVYPPAIALLYVPLAGLPYDLAAALHLLLQLACLIAAALLAARPFGLERRWAVLGTLAWGPAAAGVVSGQNTALTLLLVVLAMRALLAGRPWLAGLAGAAVLYKPQLGAPVGATLAWRRAWRVVAVVLAGAAVQYLLGVVATGGDWGWPAAWLAQVRAYTAPDFEANGWQAVSLPAFLGRLVLPGGEPGAFAGPALAGYLLGALVVVRALPALGTWSPERALALACALGLVVSPHAWVYDATLLLPAVAVFARDAHARGWPWRDRWWLALAYLLALTWPLGGVIGFVPLVLVVTLAPAALLGWWPFHAEGSAAGSTP